jgi:hypothetical protein
MTAKPAVADDMLGKIARKQWELFRRVKEGTVEPETVLTALQGLIENQADLLGIERLNWRISAEVHEVTVRESDDFVSRVIEVGYLWRQGNYNEHAFIHRGKIEKLPSKARLRLAKLPKATKLTVADIRSYTDMSGYDLATAWELLAFMQQSTATRIFKPSIFIIALGSYGIDTFRRRAFVTVNSKTLKRTWSFNESTCKRSKAELEDVEVHWDFHILLRERSD